MFFAAHVAPRMLSAMLKESLSRPKYYTIKPLTPKTPFKMATGNVDDSTNCAINNKTYNWNREFTRKYIKSFDLSYDSKRIRWSNSFESLVNFVENAINEQGKWSSKISSSRRFTSSISDFHITWYYNKQKTLLFQGRTGTDLTLSDARV